MKILGGKLKGRNFFMPADIRPTQSLLRQAVFDILGHDLSGLSFLELYAGSGAMSLEAISRGASSVTLVEHNPQHAQVIRENFELLGISLGFEHSLIQADALATVKHLSRQEKRFDIVFFDPPYGLKLAKKTLKVIGGNDILHPLCFVISQHDREDSLDIPDGFELFTERRYGSSQLVIIRKSLNSKE